MGEVAMLFWTVLTAHAVPGDLDDDGIPDAVESAQPDADQDGIPNAEDPDSDDDGVPDAVEWDAPQALVGSHDFDGDGLDDYLDPDDDDDGVPTAAEDWLSPGQPALTNTDRPDAGDLFDMFVHGDDLPDYLDVDDDADGIPTAIEVAGGQLPTSNNFDRDVVAAQLTSMHACAPGEILFCWDDRPDYLDPDDDGDGVPTFAEVMFHSDPYAVDSDLDGFVDGAEWLNSLDIHRVRIERWLSAGSCGDGLTDADGDVLLSRRGVLVPWAQWAPGDVVVSGFFDQDLDQDGVPEGLDGRSWTTPWDRDCDGDPNVLDIDDDGDGIASGFLGAGGWENQADQDCLPGTDIPVGDGVPNYLDTDSDDQPQLLVAGSTPWCPTGGPLICVVSLDGEEQGSSAWSCFDGGIDEDRDHDGLSDRLELELCPPAGFPTACPEDHPFFGMPCFRSPDSDCDGLLDCEEAGVPCAMGEPNLPVDQLPNPPDTDGDGVPDFADLDDDGDGVPTPDELDFSCPPGQHAGLDTLIFEDTTGSGFGDHWTQVCIDESTGLPVAGVEPFRHTDASTGDLIPDHRDPDDDGDGWPTAAEGTGDVDGDGLPNHLDADDRDGPHLVDADGDGIPDAMERFLGLDPESVDSDGDGFPDREEAGETPLAAPDLDGDGRIDALDPDDDGDGVPSRDEGDGDLDGDGLPNHRDSFDQDGPEGDLDGDGLSNTRELELGTDPASADTDGDGLDDRFEVGTRSEPRDTDGDGLIDALDTDSDNDLIPDAEEATDADGDGIIDAYLPKRNGCACESGPTLVKVGSWRR